jgi:hypothetical protein
MLNAPFFVFEAVALLWRASEFRQCRRSVARAKRPSVFLHQLPLMRIVLRVLCRVHALCVCVGDEGCP